jgi:hypothetical protein
MSLQDRTGIVVSQPLVSKEPALARIMHHASRFFPPGWRTHAVDSPVWIGVRNSPCNALGIDRPRRRLVGHAAPNADGPAAARFFAFLSRRIGTNFPNRW